MVITTTNFLPNTHMTCASIPLCACVYACVSVVCIFACLYVCVCTRACVEVCVHVSATKVKQVYVQLYYAYMHVLSCIYP